MKQKLTHEDALEYMSNWINQEDWDDLQIMYNFGDAQLMAHSLSGTGCISPETCYPQYKEVEEYVLKLAKQFRRLSQKEQKKRYKELLKNVITISCDECNHVSFVADKNEELYPEVLKKCWQCGKSDIRVKHNE